MGHYLSISVNDKLYQKDPLSTELGRKILKEGILLIEEFGLESFNFKKLAERIESTEASVYRYFENKHKLFLYLINWYWDWLSYRIESSTVNVTDPRRKLSIMLMVLIDSTKRNLEVEYIDEDILHKIVIVEGAKAYHHKLVDEENTNGFYIPHKKVSESIALAISELKPGFPYVHSMASMIMDTVLNSLYFSNHLPRLTDIKNDGNQAEEVLYMLEFFIDRLMA